MPSDAPLNVLALYASLKHEPLVSNTGELASLVLGEVGQPTSEDRDRRLRNMATLHMTKGLAQNLVYYARLLQAHPQTLIAGKATCCSMHADLDAPI